MKVAFLTPWTVNDLGSWSGVLHLMHRSLAEREEVVVIETGHIPVAPIDRGIMATFGRVSTKPYLSGLALATSLKKGRYATEAAARIRADVILAVAASQDVALARFNKPVVQVTDATYTAMQEYYPLFSSMHLLSKWQGSAVSKLANRKTASYCVASEWAKKSLEEDYQVADRKCKVIPFGPAIYPPEMVVRKRSDCGLRVLVIASDWKRKGGDKALEAMRLVREEFPSTTLTVVGNSPPLPDWVTSLGQVAREAMPALYAEHDILLELAEANAGGVSLTDAHAFGLPVVATHTGGVGSIVADGQTGILVDPGPEMIGHAVNALKSLHRSDFRSAMGRDAYQRHMELLNWDRWATDTLELCRATVSPDFQQKSRT